MRRMNKYIVQLRCVKCSKTYKPKEQRYTCPACGLDGILDIEYDYERILADGFSAQSLAASKHNSIWRYLPLLPLPNDLVPPPMAVGMTPVYAFPELAKKWGIQNLFVKDDGRQPTASFKDRASSVAVLAAKADGFTEIACASTGNAASSLAGWSAHVGLKAFIFVPATAPEAKVVQLRIFRATVLLVETSYDKTWELCQEATGVFGWYNRNAGVNPVMVEGKKTCGLEIAEQMRGNVPDWVSVSVGDGCTIAGIWKGLWEMKRLGVIDRVPRLLATQAEGANPVDKAIRAGQANITPQGADTIADSISVGHPRNGIKALKAIRESNGVTISVSDQDILNAMAELASATGVFGEPAGIAGIAGIQKARAAGLVKENETVLHVVTGNGLKDIQSATKAAQVPGHRVKTMDDVRKVVSR
jgi:threonine synthase